MVSINNHDIRFFLKSVSDVNGANVMRVWFTDKSVGWFHALGAET